MWLSTIKFCHFNFIVDLDFCCCCFFSKQFLYICLSLSLFWVEFIARGVVVAAKLSRSRCHFSYEFCSHMRLWDSVQAWIKYSKNYILFCQFFFASFLSFHRISISLLLFYHFSIWSNSFYVFFLVVCGCYLEIWFVLFIETYTHI